MSQIPDRGAKARASVGGRRAFMLIKLLVVVAIIALLAAILFPVFSRVRENARRSACMSNLKQLGLGLLQYTQDNDECEPYYNTVPSGQWPRGQGWATQIYPYVRDIDVYVCPGDTSTCTSQLISYLWNPNLNQVKTTSPKAGMLSSFSNTSMTVALMEGRYNVANSPASMDPSNGALLAGGGGFGLPNLVGNETYGGSIVYSTGLLGNYTTATPVRNGCSTANAFDFPAGRHLDGSNYPMADGHVKWLLASTVSPGTTATKPTDAQSASSDSWDTPSAAGTANSTYEITFSAM